MQEEKNWRIFFFKKKNLKKSKSNFIMYLLKPFKFFIFLKLLPQSILPDYHAAQNLLITMMYAILSIIINFSRLHFLR